jgi:Fe-S-cluster containining protein
MQNDERGMMNEELKEAVAAAGLNGDAAHAVRSIYAELQVEIDRRRPICVASGKCCNFETYGHRLYVTTLELAVFLSDLAGLTPGRFSQNTDSPGHKAGDRSTYGAISSPIPGLPARAIKEAVHTNSPELTVLPQPVVSGGCPLQVGRLCGVHAIRPFGCRIFFCDPTATQWQQDQYEAFHGRIKSLHQRFNVPYFYVEWREALRAIGVTT